MKDLIEIKKTNIRNKVITSVRNSKKEILTTMEITEEINSPLPKRYFLLLNKKKDSGVKIKRIVFGPKNIYHSYLKNLGSKNVPFVGKRISSKNYKRMILIDGKKLFFRKENGRKRTFYYTTSEKIINKYLSYFKKLYE
jgi:hypothetical protein